MEENLNVKILESYVEIDKINDEINKNIFDFITKALEIVDLSDDDYQIEKTILFNKISLKDYILNSNCCKMLNYNNILDYSIEDLRNYLIQYNKDNNYDSEIYCKALDLYELLEKIEVLVDEKIKMEINDLSRFVPDLINISIIQKNEYEKLYLKSKSIIDKYQLSNQLDEKSYNICLQLLDDIFDFYINGYPTIPDEYLES